MQFGITRQDTAKHDETRSSALLLSEIAGEGSDCDQEEYRRHTKTVQDEGCRPLSRDVLVGAASGSEQG